MCPTYPEDERLEVHGLLRVGVAVQALLDELDQVVHLRLAVALQLVEAGRVHPRKGVALQNLASSLLQLGVIAKGQCCKKCFIRKVFTI